MPFISFSCLFAVARTASTILKSSHEKGEIFLAPELSETASSFLPLSMMLVAGFW